MSEREYHYTVEAAMPSGGMAMQRAWLDDAAAALDAIAGGGQVGQVVEWSRGDVLASEGIVVELHADLDTEGRARHLQRAAGKLRVARDANELPNPLNFYHARA